MPALKIDKLYCAIDIGTTKIGALIVGKREDDSLIVLGAGQRESRGVKRGYVADVDACEMAVRDAIEKAERIAGTNVDTAWVGFSAGGLESGLASFETELGGHRIEQEDIDELLELGQNHVDDRGKLVLHAQPALYTLDGLEGVRNPLGLHADRLGVDIHVVLADASPVRNIEMAVCAAHLGVDAIVASPVAAGLACLSEEERELGVALVEIGGAVTNVSLYAGGMLVGLETIPYGGGDITDDIASAFGIRRLDAERIKCFHGSAASSPRDNQDIIELSGDRGPENSRITRSQLVSVIRNRLDHLAKEIKESLASLGFGDAKSRQIVLTGGGAEMAGIADYLQAALARPVRVGTPTGLEGLPEASSGPAFSALSGLILHAASEPVDHRAQYNYEKKFAKSGEHGLFARLFALLKLSF